MYGFILTVIVVTSLDGHHGDHHQPVSPFPCDGAITDSPVTLYLLQNIELKVEVESLKQELQEKQQLLDKAL